MEHESGSTVGLIIMGAIAVWVFWSKWREESRRGQPGIMFVRVVPSGSNVFHNIVVLAVLGGLAWFFWWATHTKFWP